MSNLIGRTSAQLDLKNQAAVRLFFEKERPDYVFLAAAKVGGILANNIYRGEFLYDNLMIQSNTIDAAYRSGVKKLMFLGSSCIYPEAGAATAERRIPADRVAGDRRMSPMPSPRSPASSCVMLIGRNTAVILFPSCPPICMGRMITTI